MGDFNSQNELWGSTRNNLSGLALGRFLTDSSFIYLNDGRGTRVSASPNYNSVPDLTITNSLNFGFVWTVGKNPIGSDHLPILVDLLINNHHPSIDSDTLIGNNSDRPMLSLKFVDKKLFPILINNEFDRV